jgi:uncharacterized integral membrane protein
MSTPQPPGVPNPPPTPAAPSLTPPVPEPDAKPERKEDRPSTWQPVLYLKIGLLLAAVAYSTAFVVENSKEINVHFVFATAKVRLIWEILLLLAIGMVGGILLSQLYRHRRRARLAKKAGKSRDAHSHVVDRDEAVGKAR